MLLYLVNHSTRKISMRYMSKFLRIQKMIERNGEIDGKLGV